MDHSLNEGVTFSQPRGSESHTRKLLLHYGDLYKQIPRCLTVQLVNFGSVLRVNKASAKAYEPRVTWIRCILAKMLYSKLVSMFIFISKTRRLLALPCMIEYRSQFHTFSARTKSPAKITKLGLWLQYHHLFIICCPSVTFILQIGTIGEVWN